MDSKNCAIIISSCDAYADAWTPFFTLFFRYWPDCPFPIYLISNGQEYPDARIKTIAFPKDLGWSGNLLGALKQIPQDYIIYFQEDYFLQAKVSAEKIISALEFIQKEKAAYLRLYPCPGPDQDYKDEKEIGLISLSAPYRNSTQTAIWDKTVLLSLLKEGETGWDFETAGGLERSRAVAAPFLSYRQPVINYFCTAILKGKYLYDAVRFCRCEGIILDKTKRRFENFWQYLFRKMSVKQKLRKLFKL